MKKFAKQFEKTTGEVRVLASILLTIGVLAGIVIACTLVVLFLQIFPTWVGIVIPFLAMAFIIFGLIYPKDDRPTCKCCGNKYTPKAE